MVKHIHMINPIQENNIEDDIGLEEMNFDEMDFDFDENENIDDMFNFDENINNTNTINANEFSDKKIHELETKHVLCCKNVYNNFINIDTVEDMSFELFKFLIDCGYSCDVELFLSNCFTKEDYQKEILENKIKIVKYIFENNVVNVSLCGNLLSDYLHNNILDLDFIKYLYSKNFSLKNTVLSDGFNSEEIQRKPLKNRSLNGG